MITAVYLIRHGGVDFPVRDGRQILYGEDAPLNESGEQQMRDLAGKFKAMGLKFDAIYTSPVKRGHQSAQILSDEMGAPAPIEKDGLRATRYPTWEGRPLERFLKAGAYIFVDESIEQAEELVLRTFREILDESKGKRIGVVTHEEQIGLLLHRLRRPDDSEPRIEEKLPNGHARPIFVDAEGRLIETHLRGKERE